MKKNKGKVVTIQIKVNEHQAERFEKRMDEGLRDVLTYCLNHNDEGFWHALTIGPAPEWFMTEGFTFHGILEPTISIEDCDPNEETQTNQET